MILSANDFPELSAFLDGMYHQDWPAIAPTFAGVIEDFGPRLSASEIREALSDLDRALAADANESDYATYLHATGAAVLPEAEGLTARGFLEMVRDELQKLSR